MHINLWKNECMNQWRWTFTDADLNMFSGSHEDINKVLEDIRKIVNGNETK